MIQRKLRRLETIREKLVESFDTNLTAVGNLFTNLKKSPIDMLTRSIDNAIGQLEYMKDDFKLKLDALLGLEKEDQELQDLLKEEERKKSTKK